MNPDQHQNGERYERITLSPAEKMDGFAAVMRRLKDRSADEQNQLRSRADAAVLGHEAYALGHEYLGRGNYVAAKRWLRVAADHSVPGAEQALDEIDVRKTVGGPAAGDGRADTPLCPTIPSHSVAPVDGEAAKGFQMRSPVGQRHDSSQMWDSAMKSLATSRVTAAAQTQAEQITEQARRTADELLLEMRRRIRREWAQHAHSAELSRRAIAALLGETHEIQEEAREVTAHAHRAADDLLGEARQQAQQILADARTKAARIHDEAAQRSIETRRARAQAATLSVRGRQPVVPALPRQVGDASWLSLVLAFRETCSRPEEDASAERLLRTDHRDWESLKEWQAAGHRLVACSDDAEARVTLIVLPIGGCLESGSGMARSSVRALETQRGAKAYPRPPMPALAANIGAEHMRWVMSLVPEGLFSSWCEADVSESALIRRRHQLALAIGVLGSEEEEDHGVTPGPEEAESAASL
ncbi:DivIVA domain-containing protein [Streptomyces sp. NPDC002917]|uniref:DivIVA domain-containing protein n=1 Tax=Streptomyces sp. NPDC002917 TaxID=3364671 RepID=UPI0036C4D145